MGPCRITVPYADVVMSYCPTRWIDDGDAIILSEPETSAEANQLVAALTFKWPTGLVSLNVND